MIEITEVNKLPDITMSGNGLIFLPDSLREYRTVRFITGHLVTLLAGKVSVNNSSGQVIVIKIILTVMQLRKIKNTSRKINTNRNVHFTEMFSY